MKVTYTKNVFIVDPETRIITDSSSLPSATYLQKEIKRLYNISCSITQSKTLLPGGNQITLQASSPDSTVPDHKEGYSLAVGKDRILIRAKSDVGTFYGVQTLKQLMSSNGSRIGVSGCNIVDKPALGWRGMYLNVRSIGNDPASMQAMKDLINTFASLKMNILFVEIADNILFDRQKFPQSAPHALSKTQVIELVDYAKSLHFEVIPTLQMLSHTPWIMSNPANIELLEGKATAGWATAWCATNPAVDAFARDMLEETVEIFKPRYFHVCMDEVNYGPFHECETCKKENPSELFLSQITKMHNILAAKGVRTIMWHDTLLPSGQYMTGTTDKARGWEIMDKVPRDVIIADWDYGIYNKEAQQRLRYFTEKGFTVVGATFCAPTGIQTFAEGLSKEPDTLGLFDTLWYLAGTWTDPRTMAPEAWASITLTAQYAWNPVSPGLKYIKYDPVYEISRILKPRHSDAGSWKPVPLDKVFNYQLTGKADCWPEYGAGNTLDGLIGKRISSGEVFFQTAKHKDQKNVVLLTGGNQDGLPAGPVTIPVDKKATRIAFLNTCNVPLDKDTLSNWAYATSQPPVAVYKFEYVDGSSSDLQLSYRWNIVDWNYKFGVFDGQIAYTSETKKGSRIQLIRTDWINPDPEKIIKNIVIKPANDNGMSLALFAVSCDTGLVK